MDTVSIAGSSLLLRSEQTRQVLSTAIMKQAADQQNRLADLLAQNVSQTPQPASGSGSGFTFSTYA